MRKKQERTLGFPSSSRAHPNCFLLEKFHQQQLLRNLARPHSRCRPKIPPRLHQHSKGHYENSPKNLQSTKLSPSIQHESTIMTTPTSPPMEPPVRTHLVYIIVLELTGKVLSDQTGRFPVISNRGMKYIFLLYDYNSSTILAEPIKFRSATYILATYTKLHDILKARGLKPLLAILDNAFPTALKKFFHKNTLVLQLVYPHDHRRNTAEREIGIFKDHFIAGLISLDPAFPMQSLVPCRYQYILFTALLCEALVLGVNPSHWLISKEISGLVFDVRYNIIPITK